MNRKLIKDVIDMVQGGYSLEEIRESLEVSDSDIYSVLKKERPDLYKWIKENLNNLKE